MIGILVAFGIGLGLPQGTLKRDSATNFPAPCSTRVPARFAGIPAQWLDACVNGKAEGLGVLRIGRGAPFAFLVGRMRAGRPASGLLFNPDKSYAAVRGFDSYGGILSADGYHLKEQDRVWAEAVLAARATSDRFARAGNAASAAYYHRFASEIENGRPE